MKRATIDLWVGLFAVIGCAAILFLALKVANLTGSTPDNSYALTADFDNTGGLKVRAPVKVSGVIVGRVTDIRLDTQNMRAKVTMAIDPRYAFSRDVAASINTAGLLGEQYVSLLDGGDPDTLKPGERIGITSSALVLEDLIGKFMLSFAEKGGSSDSSSGSKH